MTKIEFDTKKLNKLDRSKAYIFTVEVGNKDKDDILRIVEAIKNQLKENYGFDKAYFIPTINGVSGVVFENLDNYIIKAE